MEVIKGTASFLHMVLMSRMTCLIMQDFTYIDLGLFLNMQSGKLL